MSDPSLTAHIQRMTRQVQAQHSGAQPGLGFSRGASTPLPADSHAPYAILTPTGDRHAAFWRCMQMVADQTCRPAQWVVVDDGQVPLIDVMVLPDWITYVRRAPQAGDPPHTLSVNVLAGLDHIREDRVLVVEDDDWYSPLYAQTVLPYLEDHLLVGLNLVRYYHLQGRAWKHGQQPAHTAFAQCAFRRGHAWDHLAAVCRTNFTEIREKGVLDRHWWHTFEGAKHLITPHPCVHVGLKGGMGRAGLASGHSAREVDYIADTNGRYLPDAMGDDAAHYAHRPFRKPFALYACAVGDQPCPPLPEGAALSCDGYLFSDRPRADARGWTVLPLGGCTPDALRAYAHLVVPDYEWSLWSPQGTLPARAEALVAQCIAAQTPIGTSADADPVLVRQHRHADVTRAMVAWQRDDGTPLAQALKQTGLTAVSL